MRLVIADGAAWVANALEGGVAPFDVIIVDSTDFNAAMTLFTMEFYQNAKRLLVSSGIFVYNCESVGYGAAQASIAVSQMRDLYRHAYPYQVFQPTYASGHYTFMFCSDAVHPFAAPDPDWAAVWHGRQLATHYYTPDVHIASFVLPRFLERDCELERPLRLQQLLGNHTIAP